MNINVYKGRFGYETFLFNWDDYSVNECLPNKDEFIFWHENVYKVLYIMYDADNNEYNIFVRDAVEEDY